MFRLLSVILLLWIMDPIRDKKIYEYDGIKNIFFDNLLFGSILISNASLLIREAFLYIKGFLPVAYRVYFIDRCIYVMESQASKATWL